MSVVESKLHLPVAHKVAPSDTDMAPQCDLRKAPNIHYPFNVAAVTVCEHLRVQNQEVEITISEQPGIAPESVQINRTATRDFLPDNLLQHQPNYLSNVQAYTRPLSLQEPKQYEFALRSSAPQMVIESPKAAVINLDFAV